MQEHSFPRSFQTTRWTLVERANGTVDEEALQALATLCESYWYPIYAYIRSTGSSAHDAEDLTQGFFARLLDKGVLTGADRAKGRLRTFLLACVRNYLHNEHDRAMAQRRGARLLTSFNQEWAEERFATEPVDEMTPDRLYQRRWALTLLDFSLQLLRQEYEADGRGGLFESLRPCLGFSSVPTHTYADLGVSLGQPVGTVKNHVFRLRQRWREILFEQAALTLADPTSDEIKDELSELTGCV